MSRAGVIWSREVGAFFLRPAGYWMLMAFYLVTGFALWSGAVATPGDGVLFSELVFRPISFWMMVLLLTAAVSARSFAEEHRQGTLEWLLSAPVTDRDLVMGKFWGVFTLCSLAVLFTIVPAFCVRYFDAGGGHPDPGALAAGYLLALILVAAVAALGIGVAFVIRSPAAATLVTFGLSGVMLFGRTASRVFVDLAGSGTQAVLSRGHWMAAYARGQMDTRPIVAGVTLTFFMLYATVQMARWWRMRRGAMGLHLLANVALAAALVLAVNGISIRHYVRSDWSALWPQHLAGKTTQVLDQVREPLQVTVVSHDVDSRWWEVRQLLAEYQAACRHVTVSFVDPDRDLARTKDLARRFSLSDPEVLILEYRDRRLVVPLSSLLTGQLEAAPLRAGDRGPSSFRGEQVLTSAIHRLLQGGAVKVYFLSGHGERDILSNADKSGYAEIVQRIRRDGADVESLSLADTNRIPESGDVLVVAGPTARLPDREVGAIREYLNHRGRAVFLLDPGTQTGLEETLAEWNVKLPPGRVIDAVPLGRSLSASGAAALRVAESEVRVNAYGTHPVTAPLEGMTATFYAPRAVEPMQADTHAVSDSADKPQVTTLAWGADSGWLESNADEDPPQFDDRFDRPGPVSLAVAVEKGLTPTGPVAGIEPQRFAVIGDSQLAANGCLTGANGDFFMNALNWVLRQDYLLSIAPRPRPVFQSSLALRSRVRAFGALVLVPPALVGLIGLMVGGLRRWF